jgi:uncharacterized membrane protein
MSSRDSHPLGPVILRRVPGDIIAVGLSVFVTAGVVFIPGLKTTPLRLIVGLPFVFFVPGYALISALFPRAQRSSDAVTNRDEQPLEAGLTPSGISPIERFTLSVAASVATVILLGLVVELLPVRFGLQTVFASIGLFTLIASGLTVWRRQQLPQEERMQVPLVRWYRTCRARIVSPPTRVDGLLNVVLVLVVIFTVGSVGYAMTDQSDSSITELGLLAEQPDGDLAARGYPTNTTAGDSNRLVLHVTNLEHSDVEYTVVLQRQRMIDTGNTTRVASERTLRQVSLILAHNETRQLPFNITVQEPGRYRMNFLLYKNQPPAEPSIDTAYQEVHLWMNVTRAAN